jgi:hypothetical protein
MSILSGQTAPNLLDRLKTRYVQGLHVIASGLLNCFLTCVAGALANVAFEKWSRGALDLLPRRIAVGYLGAVGIVVFVLPWLHRVSQNLSRTNWHPLLIPDGFGRLLRRALARCGSKL